MDFEVSEPALRRWVMASTEPADVPAKRIAELELLSNVSAQSSPILA